MEVVDFMAVVFNPVAQAKFVHTVSAGYVTGAVFVMAISALFLLRNKHKDLARRSFAVAAAFGLLSSLSVVVLGDEWLRRQRTPEDEAGRDRSDVGDRACAGRLHRLRHPEPGHPPERLRGEDPYLMGLIATRSLNQPIPGIRNWSSAPNTACVAASWPTARWNACVRTRTTSKHARCSTATGRTWATACCSSAIAMTSSTPPRRRSRRRRWTPCRA